MSKREERVTTREHGYFHISNSGFSFRLLEKETDHYRDGDGPSITWEVEIRLGAFGHGVSFRFPIVANMAEYFANVFGRLHQRMEELRATGNYSTVNGDGRHSSVSNVKAYIADGVEFEEALRQEGYANVTRCHSSGFSGGKSYSEIVYQCGDERGGEGSELEQKWLARAQRLLELQAPLGGLEATGGSYRPSRLKGRLRDAVHEMTWDDSWSSGPERGEKAKATIDNFFEENPEEFWLYTAGFSLKKRMLVIERLGITDESLIKRMMRVRD